MAGQDEGVMGKAIKNGIIECNLCRGRNHTKLKDGVYGNPRQNIYKCEACRHIFLGPLLDDSEEERFYINDYPAFLLKRGDQKSSTPQDHFTKNKEEAVRRFGLIQKHLSPEKSVLEIGSASGFFLDHIKPYVKEVCGVELNSGYRDFANKMGIEARADLNAMSAKRFDIIFLYYVMEHVKDPVGFIKNLVTLLRGPGSLIIAEVPNVNEALVTFYRSAAYYKFVWQKAHCSYFSVDTLRELFLKSGLRADFIPEQRYDFSNHMHWLIEGRPGGAGKYGHIFSEALNREYSENLKGSWLCDTILAIAGL